MSPLQLGALLNKTAFRGRASHWRRMERTRLKGKTDDLHLYCWGNRDDSYLVCQSVPLYSVNTAPSFKCKFHVLLPFWILSVNLYSLKLGESHLPICNHLGNEGYWKEIVPSKYIWNFKYYASKQLPYM